MRFCRPASYLSHTYSYCSVSYAVHCTLLCTHTHTVMCKVRRVSRVRVDGDEICLPPQGTPPPNIAADITHSTQPALRGHTALRIPPTRHKPNPRRHADPTYSCMMMMMMMFTPERHLPTSGQHGPAPSGTPPPAQPPPPPQTRETQSHSAPTPLKRPMLTPEGRPRPRVKRLGTWTLVRPQKGAAARIVPKGTTARSTPQHSPSQMLGPALASFRPEGRGFIFLLIPCAEGS